MRDRILLFIPAYNCRTQIPRVLAQLDDDVLRFIEQIIVVVNPSTDQTENAVRQYVKQHPLPLTLLQNNQNYNLGGSHKVAFDYAVEHCFDYLIVLHGDDQGDIHDLLPLLKSGEYRRYDCCLGSRFIRGSRRVGYSPLRTSANVVLNLWFSLVCGRSIRDLGSGLNLYRTEILQPRFYQRFPDRLYFNAVMLLASRSYHHRMMFFPITWRENDQVSNAKLFELGFMLLKVTFLFLLGRQKFIESEMRGTGGVIEEYAYRAAEDFKDRTPENESAAGPPKQSENINGKRGIRHE